MKLRSSGPLFATRLGDIEPLLRHTSWPKKGVNWSSSDELSVIQARVKGMEDKAVRLVDVVQVMLVCLVLLCQHRGCNLWEYDTAEHRTLRELFGSSHKDT